MDIDMMLKTEIKVEQDYNVFKYIKTKPQNNVGYQNIKIVEGKGVKLAPIFFLPENRKEKIGK